MLPSYTAEYIIRQS